MIRILLCVLFVLICIHGYIVIECLKRICKPIRYNRQELYQAEIDNGFKQAIEDYEKKWEKRLFSLECNGVTLKGEVIFHPEDRRKAVIIAHGQKVNRCCSIKYAAMFYNLGYHVLIYDERYFGESSGDYSTLGQNESLDLKEVYAYAREVFGEDCRIGLHGESMGAATSLLSLRYIQPFFVVADCPFCDSTRLFNEFTIKNVHLPPFVVIPFVKILARLRYHYNIAETSPIEAVRNSDVPICFMHGTSDGLIDCDHSRQMYQVCRSELSEIHLFEGADHARSVVVDPEVYEKILSAFVKKVEG